MLYRLPDDKQALSPHIFDVTVQAFADMVDKNKCQAILISG